MSKAETDSKPQPHLYRSLFSVIFGSLLLRMAAGAMGENIQFYFNAIHAAALNPNHPLRAIVRAHNVYQISYTLGGIIIGSFFVAEVVGSLLLGAWSDRFGRKIFIIFGPIFGAIGVMITSITTVVWLLITTRLLEGLSTASNAPATLGYLAESTTHSPKLRTRISGFYEIATVGGFALGFAVGGWMWRQFGIARIFLGIPMTSPAFAINAIFYILSLAVLWFGIHEIREKNNGKKKQSITPIDTVKRYWKILSSPRIAEFAPAWIAINAVLGIWINLTARILTDKGSFPSQLLVGNFDSFQAGNIRSVYALFFIFGILIWSVFFPQLRKSTAMLIGTAGLFISCILLFIINHQAAWGTPVIYILAILLIISIMVQSGFSPAALAYLADITESHTADRGAIMGLYSVFLGVGQFLGVAIGGVFVDWRGADGMAIITGLLGIFASIMIFKLRSSEDLSTSLQTEK
jgi:MFS family permease